MRPLASVESELPLQRPRQDAHLIASLKAITSRELDQSATLASSDLRDHRIRDPRRPKAVHNQADDTDAPTGRVPLRLDGEETITRKERRPDLDPASV